MKSILKYAAIILAAAIAYTGGIVLGGILPALLGLPTSPLPEGVAVETVFLATFGASLGLSAVVAWLARGLPGRFLRRWLLLAALVWGGHVAIFVEAGIFMDSGDQAVGVTLFNVLTYLPPSLLATGVLARLVHPAAPTAAPFRAPGTAVAWLGRIGAAILAFPLIYTLFGLLVVPYVYDAYLEGAYGLTAPDWGQIIPVQFLRSALLLLVTLPVLASWRLPRGQILLRLALALYFLIGLQWTLTGVWMDAAFRVAHSLEVLADAFLYTGVLVWLFTTPEQEKRQETVVRFT